MNDSGDICPLAAGLLETSQKTKFQSTTVTCWKCGKKGHVSRECKNPSHLVGIIERIMSVCSGLVGLVAPSSDDDEDSNESDDESSDDSIKQN